MHRLVELGMKLVVVVMMLAVLILMPIGTLVTDLLQWWIGKHHTLQHLLPFLIVWQVLRYVIALALLLGVVSIMYYYGPRVKPRRQAIIPGAIFCVAVWILLGILFRVYIDRFGRYNETYGTVGGVAVLLLLFYVDAVVLLIGAELNAQVDRAMGDEPKDVPMPPDPRAPQETEVV
jgi:membrane protein